MNQLQIAPFVFVVLGVDFIAFLLFRRERFALHLDIDLVVADVVLEFPRQRLLDIELLLGVQLLGALLRCGDALLYRLGRLLDLL